MSVERLFAVDRPGKLDIDRLLWTNCLLLQSAYIRREAFERAGLFDGLIIGPGDTEWLMRMVAIYSSESFLYVPAVWSSFRFGQSLKDILPRFRSERQSVARCLRAIPVRRGEPPTVASWRGSRACGDALPVCLLVFRGREPPGGSDALCGSLSPVAGADIQCFGVEVYREISAWSESCTGGQQMRIHHTGVLGCFV